MNLYKSRNELTDLGGKKMKLWLPKRESKEEGTNYEYDIKR